MAAAAPVTPWCSAKMRTGSRRTFTALTRTVACARCRPAAVMLGAKTTTLLPLKEGAPCLERRLGVLEAPEDALGDQEGSRDRGAQGTDQQQGLGVGENRAAWVDPCPFEQPWAEGSEQQELQQARAQGEHEGSEPGRSDSPPLLLRTCAPFMVWCKYPITRRPSIRSAYLLRPRWTGR